ncbi:hypothetical protein [Parapedobacter sp. 2B3]
MIPVTKGILVLLAVAFARASGAQADGEVPVFVADDDGYVLRPTAARSG